MGTSGVVDQRRWRLPARRKRFVMIAMPAVFLIVFAAWSFWGHWWQGLGLAMAFSGLVGVFSVVFVRLEPDPGTPDPRRVYFSRREKRRMLTTARRGLPVTDEVAAWMRPMAEQIGRDSARGVLIAPLYAFFFVGMIVGRPPGWMTLIGVIPLVLVLFAGALMVRDRDACAAFLERF